MVKISGNSAFMSSSDEEPKPAVPRQFGDEVTVVVPRASDKQSDSNSERLAKMRTALKNLQESQGSLQDNYDAKQESAQKAKEISMGLKERLASFSDLNDQIDAFYQKQIEDNISADDISITAELPPHLADRKREFDGLERQIVVAESCAQKRREEAKAAYKEIKEFEQKKTDAVQQIMSYIAEMHCNDIQSLWNKYANAVVDLLGLTRQNFQQMDIYASSIREQPVYSCMPLTVNQRVYAAAQGYRLDINLIAAQYLRKLEKDQNKWSGVIKRLQEDAYADCSDPCPELPGISVTG
ncbi:hypothetical protein AA0472_1363 [Acetobacter estunensis NRIC 0472]|uniref:Uncharacterized protein n=1 Tax=Acetobacter estunensis TaxID=104097 RepID=A0A967EC60_9PROT|nr:hypothetical protein [Acetobacter estunensis]NHO54248.1 hypothetical protein [Acetobacter estunensis]GBQ24266.1 hypothetical protein AA0472_1363 [Acetobacter estunensis NRIC 0472]